MVEGRQAAGHLTWHGLETYAESEGPLALMIRDMGIEADQAYMIAQSERHNYAGRSLGCGRPMGT